MVWHQSRRYRFPLLALLVTAVLAGCSDAGRSAESTATDVSMDVVAERAAHTSTTLPDGRVFVAGGCVIDGCAIATEETALVDAEGDRAIRGPQLSQPRSSHTATLLDDGRVVIVGGFLGEGAGVSDAIEVFDPASDSLAPIGSLAQPRGGHAAARLADGRIIVLGGWTASRQYTNSVEIIEPATGQVFTGQHLPWAADALEATSMPDGRVLVTGGQVASGEATSNAAVFDPATGAWQIVSPMSYARLKHFAVLLDDGHILVGGGTPDDRTLLATTEVFDPETDRFTTGPQLHEGRYKLPGGAIALPGGRVLIGSGGTTAEILDIATGSTQVIATFEGRASFATANLLANHATLILGGYDDQIDLTGLVRVIPQPTP